MTFIGGLKVFGKAARGILRKLSESIRHTPYTFMSKLLLPFMISSGFMVMTVITCRRINCASYP